VVVERGIGVFNIDVHDVEDFDLILDILTIDVKHSGRAFDALAKVNRMHGIPF